MALSFNPTRKQSEIGFAAALMAVATWGFVEAGAYPTQSAGYPRVLCIMLAGASALVILRAALAQPDDTSQRLLDHPGRFLLGFTTLLTYIVAVDLLGYVVPSLVVGIGLPVLLGYKNLRLVVPVVACSIAVILLVFAGLLERPLPPDILDFLLESVL
ncbi:tripartite tricarboxylate transporter TctB family protein [Rhizobium sp. FY34]|uniref:tripartite tricarboxylate transporter TctB family protein n=1 Tax=Rhizobium sp. FY34 TaxID=2562309 RepID=UPI0010BFE098|nr:tripartite tricarboxylate transporter TctB family protein [Rhizobium sp. FY34]